MYITKKDLLIEYNNKKQICIYILAHSIIEKIYTMMINESILITNMSKTIFCFELERYFSYELSTGDLLPERSRCVSLINRCELCQKPYKP